MALVGAPSAWPADADLNAQIGSDRVAQDKTKKVTVEISGGKIPSTLSTVLGKTVTALDEFPTKTVQLSGNDDFCATAQKSFNAPVACNAALISIIKKLNPNLDPKKLAPGSEMTLPDLAFEPYERTLRFRMDSATDMKRFEAAKTKYADQVQSIKTYTLPEGLDVLSFRNLTYGAYRLHVPVKQEDAPDLTKILKPLQSPDVAVRVQNAPKAPAQHSIQMSGDTVSACAISMTPTEVQGELPYMDFFHPRFDTRSAIECKPTACVGDNCPEVIVLDDKIFPSPDLPDIKKLPEEEITPAPSAATFKPMCTKGKDVRQASHATHLAGIIASRQNNVGFVGMAPDVRLAYYTWDGQNEDDMRDFLQRYTRDDSPVQTYLFPSHFAEFQGRNTALLPDLAARYSKLINQEVREGRSLMIVSAGQPDVPPGGEAPIGYMIHHLTAMSPQNIGDLRNVVVVAACSNCDGERPRIWPTSNYGKADEALIQLAAPGGDPVLGLLDGTDIGVGRGTSQAAAFVAGVAARMAGCYPESYGTPKFVKERLLLTALPLVSENTPERERISLVDPSMAMVNPKKAWLKREQSAIAEIQPAAWCKEAFDMPNANGNRLPGDAGRVVANQIRRIVRIQDKWVVIRVVPKGDGTLQEIIVGEPSKIAPQTPVMALADGVLTFGEIVDMVLPRQMIKIAAKCTP